MTFQIPSISLHSIQRTLSDGSRRLSPLKITKRRVSEVPPPAKRTNSELEQIKAAISALQEGEVIEIDIPRSGLSSKGIKNMISRAGNQTGTLMEYWEVASKLYAQPKNPLAKAPSRRGIKQRGVSKGGRA